MPIRRPAHGCHGYSSSRNSVLWASCLALLQATSTRGVPACIRRVAGCATPTGSAGHPGATANLKLTFHLDHSAGADQSLVFSSFPRSYPQMHPRPRAASTAPRGRRMQAFAAIFADGIRPTPRVRSWTRQASYTCRYRLADIVPSRLPCGPNLVAAATAAACRRAGRNPCRSFVAVAPFLLSVRLELPGWKCSAGRDARSLGQARASGREPALLCFSDRPCKTVVCEELKAIEWAG